MSVDPGLQNDLCPFIEANSGDGGNHNVNGQWYLSPDINLTGPLSGANIADANQPNPVVVTAHLKPACTPEGDAHNVLVELWVGNPSLAMAPNINTRQIGATALIPFASFVGNKANHTFTWTPPSGAVNPDPEAPGHKCLISRVYTDSATAIPDSGSFHLADDQHSAQHNITIVAAPAGKMMSMNFSTGNPDKINQKLLIHVVQNTRQPSAAVLAALSRNRAFQTIATQPFRATIAAANLQRHIATELVQTNVATHGSAVGVAAHPLAHVLAAAEFKPVVPGVELAESLTANATTGKFGALTTANLQLMIAIRAQAFDTFTFTADLTHAQKGHALAYDLTQTGADGKTHGGNYFVVIPL